MANTDSSCEVTLRCMVTSGLTDASARGDTALLDAEERQKLQRLKFAEDRRHYAAAHAMLRRMLTDIAPDTAPEAWRFHRTERGKPFIDSAQTGGSPIHVSLSHTRGLVACVISRDGEVGVDIECDAGAVDYEQLATGSCSLDEQVQLGAAGLAAREALFLDFWSLKEAYVKARGIGIDVELDSISFDLRRPSAISASVRGMATENLWMALLKPTAVSRIAVALLARPNAKIRLDAVLVTPDGSVTPMEAARATTAQQAGWAG